MQIAAKTVVTLEYELKNPEGEVLDTSKGRGPFAYLHGAGQIVPGLEEELAGHVAGDELRVEVPCAKGYGERDEARTFQAQRGEMGIAQPLEVGMQLLVDTGQGQFPVQIARIEGETVTLDANHPLAGVDLHFAVTVLDVRDATLEELSHGHAHGPGGAH